MQTFAIDTCFDIASVAVRTPDGALWCAKLDSGSGQAEAIVAVMAEAQAEAGVALQKTTRIVAVNGPGGFTGQRVGIAVAQAIALASGARCFVISSLNAAVLALLADEGSAARIAGRNILVVSDAKRGQVYLQSFDPIGRPVTEPACLAVSQAAATSAGFDGVVCGSAVALIRNQISGATAFVPGPVAFETRASDILDAPDRLGLAPVDKIRPLYLRAPDAAPARSVLPRG